MPYNTPLQADNITLRINAYYVMILLYCWNTIKTEKSPKNETDSI